MNKKIWLFLIIGLIAGVGIGFFIAQTPRSTPSSKSDYDSSAHQHIESSAHPEIWTCSMDPQVRQPEPGACPICGMDLIPLDNNSSNSDPLVLEMTEDAVKLANIQTTVVGTSGAAENTILLNGKIQADERRSSSQTAHIPGRIEQLFVTFTGEKISKGQKLATIYSPILMTAQKELLEALKLQETNPELVEAARKKLRNWRISDGEIQAIEEAGEISEVLTLYAEKSGVITQRRIAVGDYVKQGQILFDLIDLNKLWVLFDGYEEDLSKIKIGDEVEFSTPALPGKQFYTRINFIDPIIDPNTRVAALRAEVNNASGLLKPEMFVRGIAKSKGSDGQQLIVPKSAVLWTGKRSVVYVKLSDLEIPSFKYREITLGASTGEGYLVESGLEVGEEVVTYGNFAIDAAAQLNNQQSMMNKNVQIKGQEVSESEEQIIEENAADAYYVFLENTLTSYLELKDALVATDSVTSVSHAQKLVKQLGKLDSQWFEENRQDHWETQNTNMIRHANLLKTKTGIEEQRNQFEHISNILINMIKSFGTRKDTLYLQHCPMVDRNRGADWISSEEKIQNPYFGYKMMTCGRVKETFAEK
jgi:Cu(I)/Ag(I) efflux system membrane fusion protein